MNFLSFFSPQTIYRTSSRFNGAIEVVEFLGKRELVVGGLQQSGWLVQKLWKAAISTINNQPSFAASGAASKGRQSTINNILILGLGAGSVLPIINRYYPNAKIVGVEIDPVIIDTGKKFFALESHKNVTIVTADAFTFIDNHIKKEQGQRIRSNSTYHWSTRYDLILIDLYRGGEVPKKLRTQAFFQKVKGLLSKDGVVMINHLRGKGREKDLKQFEKLLYTVFAKVDVVKPLVNQVYIARS